jgi:hypothetical protein
MKINWIQLENARSLAQRIAVERHRIEIIWDLVSKPLQFPQRLRREDREIPKAA